MTTAKLFLSNCCNAPVVERCFGAIGCELMCTACGKLATFSCREVPGETHARASNAAIATIFGHVSDDKIIWLLQQAAVKWEDQHGTDVGRAGRISLLVDLWQRKVNQSQQPPAETG